MSMNLNLERDIIMKEETYFINVRQNESSQEISVKFGQKARSLSSAYSPIQVAWRYIIANYKF
jgi:hypothetical protein